MITRTTRRGVAYNFRASPYRFRIDSTIYIFSSRLHLDKFKFAYLENRVAQNLKLEKRYGYTINFTTYHDLVLYEKIESRGFLIEDNDRNFIEKLEVSIKGEKLERNI